MPGNPTAFGAQVKLNYITGKALAYGATFPTYIALCTANFADDALLTGLPEVTTPGYSRQPVAWSTATNARPSVIGNSAVITFGPVTQDMAAPVTHAALVTVVNGTAGDVLYKWVLDSPQQAVNGQALQIAIQKLQITES